MASAQHQVDWFWVKGHAGVADNELADGLATRGMEEAINASATGISRGANSRSPAGQTVAGLIRSSSSDALIAGIPQLKRLLARNCQVIDTPPSTLTVCPVT
ncbi:hypothetical protein ABIA65_003676 [Mycolicibacterium sp. 624]